MGGMPPLSVTELSHQIKKTVEGTYARVRVKAEISGFKMHTSGHAYLALKDSDSVMDAVIWRGTPVSIKLEDGLSIIASGRITTYPARSKYQMVIDHVEPAGLGELMKLFHERKEKFKALGYYDKKKPLPTFPRIIGVITSRTGAVLWDIIHRIKDRFPCHVIVWPVLVQGDGASSQIAKAIEGFHQLPIHPDVIIVARGGGSFEDLWPFNEEDVLHAVYAATIPIISAVGHETDTTLCDYVADLRAPTPTAAAELATPVLNDLVLQLNHLSTRLLNAYSRLIKEKQFTLHLHLKGLIDPIRLLNEKTQRLDEWIQRLESLHQRLYLTYLQRYQHISNRLLSPQNHIERQTEKLSHLSQRLHASITRKYETIEKELQHIVTRLENSSYEKTLQKGFCMMVDEHQKPLTSVHQFAQKTSQKVDIRLKDGQIHGVITVHSG